MFMSVIASVPGVPVHPELAGARVLLTGVTASFGVDIARAIADHKAELVLQMPDTSPELTEVTALLAQHATSLKVFNDPMTTREAARALVKAACKDQGGIDAAINLIHFSKDDLAGLTSEAAIDGMIAAKLSAALELTRVAANRMSVTWTHGSILNIVLMDEPTTPAETAITGIVRAALAAMTRGEAETWAEHAIRINAVGPRTGDIVGDGAAPIGASLRSEPEIASLALYLAGRTGRQLTGHVFDVGQIHSL
jgi:NAD(P)-dependent dehydrogenase (short-subunit alcohol dehydrogenase family)